MPRPYSDPFFMQHLGAVAIDCQNGITGGTNNNVEEITGSCPLSVQEFVMNHRDAFDVAATAVHA
jgi:NAD(P)H dehydrogenase (quinone)